MPTVRTILFPLELVEASRDIVPWVNLMAEQFQSEVHVLHVIPDPGYWGVAYGISPKHLDDEPFLIRRAEEKAGSFCVENMAEGLTFKIQAVVGDPPEEILRYAKEQDISMIVMGATGRRGLEKAVFGSVADHVIRSSSVPVLCVHPPKQK